MTQDPARSIPEPVKREVQQRCGFGCVICGLPLYEYEHMMEWAEVKRHVADEITLLCDQHHREKTGRLLPISAVKKANLNPFNLRAGSSKPYDLHYEGDFAAGIIGGNRFVASLTNPPHVLHFLTIDGISIINFSGEDGHLFLNMNLLDSEGSTILVIEKNTLVYSTDTWDITLIGRNLILRQAQRKILFDISFETPNKIILNRANISMNSIELKILPDSVLLIPAYMEMSGNVSIGANAGIRIGRRVGGAMAMIGIDEPPRHKDN